MISIDANSAEGQKIQELLRKSGMNPEDHAVQGVLPLTDENIAQLVEAMDPDTAAQLYSFLQSLDDDNDSDNNDTSSMDSYTISRWKQMLEGEDSITKFRESIDQHPGADLADTMPFLYRDNYNADTGEWTIGDDQLRQMLAVNVGRSRTDALDTITDIMQAFKPATAIQMTFELYNHMVLQIRKHAEDGSGFPRINKEANDETTGQ